MARLPPGEALGHAAGELQEARNLLIALEQAVLEPSLVESAPALALQQVDLLAQMLEELGAYLDGVARALGREYGSIDLSEPLQRVRLEAMRHRLTGSLPSNGTAAGVVDLF